jgi:ketosteroid isomerase-like protein
MSEESTPPDLVEMTRRVFDAFNSRDLDAALRFCAPDVVVDMTRTLGVSVQGLDEWRAFLDDWLVGYEEFTYTAEEIIDAGNGVGLVVYLQTARPTGATGYVSQREAAVVVVKEGLAVAQTAYPQADIDEARAAAQRLAEERR